MKKRNEDLKKWGELNKRCRTRRRDETMKNSSGYDVEVQDINEIWDTDQKIRNEKRNKDMMKR